MTESVIHFEERQHLIDQVSKRMDTLGHVLSRASRLFHEQALEAVHVAGFVEVRESWIGLLRYLTADGVRITELADRLGTTKQAVGQLVNELERAGYLERVPDPSDGRAKLVRMTDRGWGAWLAGLDALSALETALARDIGPDALQLLREHSGALLNALERRCSGRE